MGYNYTQLQPEMHNLIMHKALANTHTNKDLKILYTLNSISCPLFKLLYF